MPSLSVLRLRPPWTRSASRAIPTSSSSAAAATWAHTLPMKYWVETTTADVDVHCEIAAEFLACPPKTFNKDSVCVFSTRTGTTPEIIEAAKFCQEQGARTLMYVSNDNTPATEYADYKFFSFAEDDVLCEAIYTYQITLVARFLKNAGASPSTTPSWRSSATSPRTSSRPRTPRTSAAPPWPRTSGTPTTTW